MQLKPDELPCLRAICVLQPGMRPAVSSGKVFIKLNEDQNTLDGFKVRSHTLIYSRP